MKIYNYHKITKEFLFESEAKLDPLETKLKKENVYLIPNNATEQPIPKKILKGQIVVFENNKWVIKKDIRGIYYSIEDGKEIKVNFLDYDISNLTKIPRPSIYHIWNNNNWELTKEKEEEKIRDERLIEIKQKIQKKLEDIVVEQLVLDGELNQDDLVLLSGASDERSILKL